jgi:predicted negative regulator of RcsB-dependent stress response
MTYRLELDESAAAVRNAAGTAEDLRRDFQSGHQAALDIAAALAESPVVAGALTALRGEVFYPYDEVINSVTHHNVSSTGAALEVYREGDIEMTDRGEGAASEMSGAVR